MAGQSINDRITAARYSLAGQGLAKSVCKATTEEVIGPKKKHLEYLIQCTNEPNVSIPQLANLLIERTQMQSWVSVFKALISVHHLMCYGNERFTQYLASSNCNFNLGGFLDKTGNQEQPQLSYDMSTFIRRYAKYINEKAVSYRGVAFDFCKVKRGKEEASLRTMSTETLLKTLPVLQSQLDALLDFDCTSSELNNGVINSAFMLLFRDLIRLFACYNDGIINLLEKFFEMNKKQARDALDGYKKFLIRMDRVAEFLKVAESVGIDKGEIPDLKKAPSSLLDALEAHLANLEGKKVPTTGSSGGKLENAVSILSSTSSSFGLACSNGRIGEGVPTGANSNGGPQVDEITKRAALAEEEALYEKLKKQSSDLFDNFDEAGKHNPFLSSPTAESAAAGPTQGAPIVDLFGNAGDASQASAQAVTKASDDLLQLSNPFADIGSTMPTATSTIPSAGAQVPLVQHQMPPQQQQQQQQPFSNGFSQSVAFVPDTQFEAVFGSNCLNNNYQSFDGFGEILKPEGKVGAGAAPVGVPTAASTQPQKLISGDLDMSLSSLVENLNIKGPAQPKNQWSSPKAQNKTGGTGWSGAGQPASVPGGQNPQWGAGQPFGGAPGQMGMVGGVPANQAGQGIQPPFNQAIPTSGTQFDPLSGL